MNIVCKLILCFFCLVIAIYSQDESSEKKIDQLFDRVSLQDAQKDHLGVVRTLIDILKIDPSNIIAKNQLRAALSGYLKEVVDDEELLNSALYYLPGDIKIPAAPLIVHYYNTGNIDQVELFINNLYRGNKPHFKIPLQPLFEMNHTINPSIYKKILVWVRPFVYDNEQSEYLFLNLLAEPNHNQLAVLNELNLNLDNLVLCNNPDEFPRLLDLYYKKNPNPSSSIINSIKENLSDCLNFTNPAYRAIYFYKNGNWKQLNNLISSELTGKAKLSVSHRDLLEIDVNENPAEAKNLIKIFAKYLSTEIDYATFNDTELYNLALIFKFMDSDDTARKLLSKINFENYNLVKLYNKRLFQQFDLLITKPADQPLDLKISDYELQNFDILIDSVRARSLFIFLLDDLNQKKFVGYEDKYLYNFAKICHKLKINNKNIFTELVNRITPSSSFDNMILGSLSCLMTGDQGRAERILNSVESLGSTIDLAYLQIELNWWNTHGMKSNFIDQHLEKINGISDKEEKQYFTTKSDSQTQIISATEDNFYALLIGVESYKDKSMNLRFPIKDLNNLKAILVNDYLFAEKNVITLANPERAKFFETFQELKKQIGQQDNLLIFYAGHGYWEESMGQGYWIPSDATGNDKSNWISNSEIVSLLKGIKAKHTLLVADACFSGSIFITRKTFLNYDKSLEIAYSKVSKKGMTSGANSPVPDKSVFVEFFIKRLKENESKYLLAQQLYLDFREAVTNNSQVYQRPLYEELEGDEGGEFIFIKK